MKKNVCELVCKTCDDNGSVSNQDITTVCKNDTKYKYRIVCKMKTNTSIKDIETSTELANFSIQYAQWPTNSYGKDDNIDSFNVNIPLTYADIYKLVRYINTKMQFKQDDLSIDNYLEFTYPCKGNNGDYRIAFKLFDNSSDSASKHHRVLWINVNNPKSNCNKHNVLNCILGDNGIENLITYLANNLFNLYYTEEEVEEIEDNT